MDLRNAITLAHRFAGKEAPFDQIQLIDGKLIATNGYHGVIVDAEDTAGAGYTVTASDLHTARTVMKGAGPHTFRVTKAHVVVESGAHKYSMRRRSDRAPDAAGAAAAAGARVTALTQDAKLTLTAAASLAEDNLVQPQLAGLRLTPQWVGGATLTHAWVIWLPGLVNERITVDPFALQHTNPTGVGERDGVLVTRSEGVAGWSSGLAAEYPDATIETLIAAQRDHTGRAVLKLDLPAFEGLIRIAASVQAAPADLFALRVDRSVVHLVRHAEDDRPGYEGQAECGEAWADHALDPVGVSPQALLRVLWLCRPNNGDFYLAVGGPTQPVVIWGGDPVVEVVLFPGYLG